jgi:hypothetical protein
MQADTSRANKSGHLDLLTTEKMQQKNAAGKVDPRQR